MKSYLSFQTNVLHQRINISTIQQKKHRISNFYSFFSIEIEAKIGLKIEDQNDFSKNI